MTAMEVLEEMRLHAISATVDVTPATVDRWRKVLLAVLDRSEVKEPNEAKP